MSGVAVIQALLAGNTQLVAAVPAARIFGGPIPPKTALPAIAVMQISGTERLTVSMSERRRQRTERIQVTVEARDYPTKKTVLELVRGACGMRVGDLNGVSVMSVLPAGEGPDLDDPETPLYSQSRDFIVSWRTPTPAP